MLFIRDTELSLHAVVALVNTLPEPATGRPDTLDDEAAFEAYLERFPYTGARMRDERELAAVRANRPRLRDAGALPQLVIHDDFDWHIHATEDGAPLATRMLVEAAMAFVDVIRTDQYERVRVCSADDCRAVYIDFSKNGSKRYCDTGNCGNRMNVNAYRRRKARESA